MRLYRFHALGKGDAVLDLRGRWLPSLREVRRHADRVALEMMAGVEPRDWTAWAIDVRDTAGRSVLWRTFTDAEVVEAGRGRD